MVETGDWARTTIDSDTLVARLRDTRDQGAWYQAEARYGPLVEAFARRLGLDNEFTQDARQEAMAAFAEALRADRFDRRRGRLRDFLFGIARNKILDIRNREMGRLRRALQPDETAFFDRLASDDQSQQVWEAEWQLAVRAQCLKEAQEKFSPDTYLMFHRKAIEGLASSEVAQLMNKTPSAVDMAAHHVRTFLRQIRPVIEEVF